MAKETVTKKRIGVFIDGSNVWHCQKENGWRIDFYRFKKYCAKRGVIKGLFYFTPDAPHLIPFLRTLSEMGYAVVKKPLKKRSPAFSKL